MNRKKKAIKPKPRWFEFVFIYRGGEPKYEPILADDERDAVRQAKLFAKEMIEPEPEDAVPFTSWVCIAIVKAKREPQ